jgi:hypothetical protein
MKIIIGSDILLIFLILSIQAFISIIETNYDPLFIELFYIFYSNIIITNLTIMPYLFIQIFRQVFQNFFLTL